MIHPAFFDDGTGKRKGFFRNRSGKMPGNAVFSRVCGQSGGTPKIAKKNQSVLSISHFSKTDSEWRNGAPERQFVNLSVLCMYKITPVTRKRLQIQAAKSPEKPDK